MNKYSSSNEQLSPGKIAHKFKMVNENGYDQDGNRRMAETAIANLQLASLS
jgi:hypothetical protein